MVGLFRLYEPQPLAFIRPHAAHFAIISNRFAAPFALFGLAALQT